MKLSALKTVGKLEIIRDGDFTALGRVHRNTPDILSFIVDGGSNGKVIIPQNISCLITRQDLSGSLPDNTPFGLAFSDDPETSFFAIHNFLARSTDFYGVSFPSTIGKHTTIHPTAYIAETRVRIGDNCSIGPNVTILEGTVIENNVIIRAGTTIGSESQALSMVRNGFPPVISTGGVCIRNDVEIQSNCCISCAVLGGFTEIGECTKIDNLVHIGSGAAIGKRCMIVALAVVGSDTLIGDEVWVGPGSVVLDNIQIGDRAYVTLGSVVTEDVRPGHRVTGNFAIEHDKFLKFLKTIR